MRIGIDATPIPPQPVGAGNYIIQLTRALVGLESEHEWVVFAQRRGQALIDLAPQPNLQWVIVPNHSPAQRLIWEQTSLPWLAQKHRLDLLHSLHYTRPAILPCASVVTFHDMTFFLYPQLHTPSKRLFFPLAMRWSARFAQALIAVSESTRRDAMRILNLPNDKIFTVPSGIDRSFRPITDPLQRQACKEKYQLPDRFILYVGLIEPRKNIPMLIKAYARLHSAPPLVLVGRLGWMTEDLMKLIEETGMKDQIILTGYIPPEDLPIVYNLSEIFAYPSLYEGFGFPPLEAMACGVPVITTAISAMMDLIGEGGLLIPPQNEVALAEAMQKLLDNATLRQELSRRGRQQAAQYTWENTATQTMQVYQLAIKRARSR